MTDKSSIFAELILIGNAARAGVARQLAGGDVVTLGSETFPVFLVPLLYVAAGIEAVAAALEEVAVGAPVWRDTNVDIVLIEGGDGGGRREEGVVV